MFRINRQKKEYKNSENCITSDFFNFDRKELSCGPKSYFDITEIKRLDISKRAEIKKNDICSAWSDTFFEFMWNLINYEM